MTIFISHQSAQEYWAGPYARLTKLSPYYRALPSGPAAQAKLDFERLRLKGIGESPIHVTVGDPAQRIFRKDCISHVMQGSVRAESFVLLYEGVWVAAPALMFCQVASEYSFHRLVKLGYELCANYHVNPITDEFDTQEAFVTARRLQEYCAKFGGRGARKARAAAQYVRGNTESPAEVALAMLLTLPRMYGGYGLPPAEPNYVIRIRSKEKGKPDKEYRGDLVWPRRKVIVEYDSNMYHTTPQKISEDAERRNRLQDAGWRVITVTRDQVRSSGKTDELADQVRRALGEDRGPAPAREALLREELRKLLYPWAFPWLFS